MTNHHFNILIVEDEAIVAADLSARLTHSGFHVIGIADNYNEAIALFNEHKPDLILLDITIKGNKTGIDIATTINQILPTPFIFITAHVDADSIDKAKNTFPAAFLVKPFTTSHLLISVELAIHNFAYQKKGIETENKLADNEKDDFYPKQEYLFIKEGYKFIKIHQQDVLFLEAQDNYVKICTTQKSYLVRCTLAKTIERLNNNLIVRVHRSYCININHINSFTEHQLKIANYNIPIGKNYKEEFLQHFEIR